MLRINQVSQADGSCLFHIEGRLCSQMVPELAEACQPALDRRNSLTLDLSKLLFADREGIHLLATLADKGVFLKNASPLCAAQVDQIRETLRQ